MKKLDIENKLFKRYGHKDFELISWTVSKAPVTFKCLRCGEITTLSRLESLFCKDRKNLCSKCRNYSLRAKGLEFKKKFEEWYKQEGKNKYDLITNFSTARNKIELKCKKCGTIQKRGAESLLKDDRCLACEKKCVIKKTNNALDLELQEKFDNEYLRIGEYVDANTPILFKHTICGKYFSMKPHQLLTDKSRCPCYVRESKGEQRIENFLKKNNINYIHQYRLDNIKKAPFDFYLSDFNILIEYQGIQHFQPVDFFGGEKQFNIQKEIDERKKNIALSQGYKIIYFTYQEKNILEELLIQRLSQLGVHSSEWKEQTSFNKDDDIV